MATALSQQALIILHNGQHLSRAGARQLLRSGANRLLELESEQAHISAAMQQLLRRQNSVHASYQRTGRLMYKCELHSLGRAFEVHCTALRTAEERCMQLEREMCALDAKLRRADRRERHDQRREAAAEAAKKKAMLRAEQAGQPEEGGAAAVDAVSTNSGSGSSSSSFSSANSSLNDSMVEAEVGPELEESECIVVDGATKTGAEWPAQTHNDNVVDGVAKGGDATVPTSSQLSDDTVDTNSDYEEIDGDAESDEDYDDYDEDVYNVSFYDGLSTSV